MITILTNEPSTFLIDVRSKKIIDDYGGFDIVNDLRPILTDQGIDLLFRIMNPVVSHRWCCQKALKHSYFVMSGGGQHIARVRLVEDCVTYTKEEYRDRSMELCYLDEIHRNYMNDIIPVLPVVYTELYNRFMLWILSRWNSSNNIFTIYDTIINSQLLIKRLIDQFVDQSGPNDLHALVMLTHSIYDSILRRKPIEYFLYNAMTQNRYKVHQLHQLMIDQLLIKNNIRFDFIPIWSHVMYISLQLCHQLEHLHISDYLQQLTPLIGKWALFFFIQDIPYNQPITTWELVKFCAIYVLSPIVGTSIQQLNQKPLVDWLTLSSDHCQFLEQYYRDRLDYITKNLLSLENSQVLTLTFFS